MPIVSLVTRNSATGQDELLSTNAAGALSTSANLATVSAAYVTSQVVVATTATAIFADGVGPNLREIHNSSGATVFIGPAGVTISNGRAIPAGGTFRLDVKLSTAPLFGIVAATTATVTTLAF